MQAARQGHVEMMKVLIQTGAGMDFLGKVSSVSVSFCTARLLPGAFCTLSARGRRSCWRRAKVIWRR
jgi:hypothetical protein